MLTAPLGVRAPFFYAALAVTLAACGDSGTTTTPTGSAATQTSSASSAPTPVAAMPPTCDAYVEKMRACIAKAPEADRAARTKAVEATHAAWVEQSKDPKTASNLIAACQAALTAVEADATCK
jgi:hypothetical protein